MKFNPTKAVSKAVSKTVSKSVGKLLIPFFVLVLVAMFGCAAMQDIIIPAYIAPAAIEYADVNDATSFVPYTSLWDAKRVANQMKRKSDLNQRDLGRLLVDDASLYTWLAGDLLLNIQNAEELKSNVFSPTGPIGLLVPTLAAFGIGAMGVTRPRDKRKLQDRDKKIVDLEKTVVENVTVTTMTPSDGGMTTVS